MAWPKGVSGNPAGRPKEGTGLMEIIRREISHEDITEALKKLLVAGDPKIPQYLADRELGRPAQAIHVSGDQDKPLHMLVGVEGRNLAPEQQITGPEQDAMEGEAEAALIEGTAPNHQLSPVPEGWGDGAVTYLEDELSD